MVTTHEFSKPYTEYKSSWGAPHTGLHVAAGGSLTLTSGEYWVDRATILGGLEVSGEVVLHVYDWLNISGNVNTPDNTDNLTIIAYYSF